MSEKNTIETLLYGIEHPEIERTVFDAVLDGETPVKVLVARAGFSEDPDMDAVVPLAILLTEDLFNRVTPVGGLTRESDEDYEARVGGAA